MILAGDCSIKRANLPDLSHLLKKNSNNLFKATQFEAFVTLVRRASRLLIALIIKGGELKPGFAE
jgi:hypothetical protein